MASGFIGEIRMFGFGFAPRFWATCDGQTLAINQNQALFSILGTTYGGNGTTNFLLPNLQGRVPLHSGQTATPPPGLTPRSLGQNGGNENVTLATTEMPAHTHPASASTAVPTVGTPAGNLWAQGNYSASGGSAMAAGDIGNAGGNQPHPNLSPYLVVNFCICLSGIFPSRN